jgi:hypothetical protein
MDKTGLRCTSTHHPLGLAPQPSSQGPNDHGRLVIQCGRVEPRRREGEGRRHNVRLPQS